MRNVWLSAVFVISLLCPASITSAKSDSPDLGGLQLVTQLPTGLPQKVSGFAYDGEKLWATIYGSGRYATLNPATLIWTVSAEKKQQRVISEVSGDFRSPGGIYFVAGKLWIAGSSGDSFGSVDLQNWKVERLFKGRQREATNPETSQMYSDIAYDGSNLWIVWHWFMYKRPDSQTQLLLKVNPETGKVIGEYPAPAGTRNDVTHGLTWDGRRLWHMKDHKLSSIDPATGGVTAQYTLAQIERPSGLAWDGQSLWIVEFKGKIWRLPFRAQ